MSEEGEFRKRTSEKASYNAGLVKWEWGSITLEELGKILNEAKKDIKEAIKNGKGEEAIKRWFGE